MARIVINNPMYVLLHVIQLAELKAKSGKLSPPSIIKKLIGLWNGISRSRLLHVTLYVAYRYMVSIILPAIDW